VEKFSVLVRTLPSVSNAKTKERIFIDPQMQKLWIKEISMESLKELRRQRGKHYNWLSTSFWAESVTHCLSLYVDLFQSNLVDFNKEDSESFLTDISTRESGYQKYYTSTMLDAGRSPGIYKIKSSWKIFWTH
jgi:hypothetical protein